MAEVSRDLVHKWNKTPQQAEVREKALREHFPEAWVEEYEPFVSLITNDRFIRRFLSKYSRAESPKYLFGHS